VLSLGGRKWIDGKVERWGYWLKFGPKSFEGGMSGSPILSARGEAVGVVSTTSKSPVIVDRLDPWLLRAIVAAEKRIK